MTRLGAAAPCESFTGFPWGRLMGWAVPLAFVGMAAPGCDGLLPTEPDASFQLSEPEYALMALTDLGPDVLGVDIPFTFENRTDGSLRLGQSCIEMQKRDGQSWKTVLASPRISLFGVCQEIRAAPGERIDGTARVAFYTGADDSRIGFPPPPPGGLEGLYRLIFEVYPATEGKPAQTPIPLEHRVSSTFFLRSID